MRRIHNGNGGTIKEFQNGNMNIKFEPWGLENIRNGKFSDIELLNELLFWVDTYFIGDEFCLSNYDMGATLYNCNFDKIYIISFSDIDTVLKSGKTLKLYARTPDHDDRDFLTENGF